MMTIASAATSSGRGGILLPPETSTSVADGVYDGGMQEDEIENQMRQILEEYKAQLLTVHEPRSAVLIGIYIPLFIASLVGNIFVLGIVLPFRRMRNVTHCFIVNLAISDLLLTLVCVPTAIGQSVYKAWLYGETMCKITGFMQGVTVSSSVFTIAILSADRLLAIRRPMSFRIYRAGRHAWVIVAIVWVASIAVASPLLSVRQLEVGVGSLVFDIDPVIFCLEKWPNSWRRRAYGVTLFVVLFALPGLFTMFSYGLIGRHLCIEDNSLFGDFEAVPSPAVRSRQTKRILAGRRRIARMLGAIAVAFAICWMPYQLVSLYVDFLDNPKHSLAIDALPFTILLGHSNSAFNPLLYCIMNYRLHRRRRSQQPTPGTPVAVVGGGGKRLSQHQLMTAGAMNDQRRRSAVGNMQVRCVFESQQKLNGFQGPNRRQVNKQVTVDNGCKPRCNGFAAMQQSAILSSLTNNNNNNNIDNNTTRQPYRSINAVIAATQLAASISSDYGTMQGHLRAGGSQGQGQGHGPRLRLRSASLTDACDTLTTTHDDCSSGTSSTRQQCFRQSSLGSPTSTTSIGSGSVLSPPSSSAHHQHQQQQQQPYGCGSGAETMLNVQLDIPTTINEESSSRSGVARSLSPSRPAVSCFNLYSTAAAPL